MGWEPWKCVSNVLKGGVLDPHAVALVVHNDRPHIPSVLSMKISHPSGIRFLMDKNPCSWRCHWHLVESKCTLELGIG